MVDTKKTTLRLGDDFAIEVREFCKKKGYTVTGLVKRLLREEIKRDPVHIK